MEERLVTVDGTGHPVPRPFMVVATQNPVEMDGTYRLPEAQLDRFLMRISVGYPDERNEVEVLRAAAAGHSVDQLHAVTDTTPARCRGWCRWPRAYTHRRPALSLRRTVGGRDPQHGRGAGRCQPARSDLADPRGPGVCGRCPTAGRT
ncbi:AAA family ATPase [Fodinicola feengrottensis]|uniref:AAA family ATPase n=1 Tax=Fodinicola feengrottensis TaxID=435914 RepID=UPI002441227F|nr:AAA family ATPase [Fodinicola feengrottensis]